MQVRFAVAALASLVVLAGGCASDPPDPFGYVYGTGVGPWITQPGWENGYLFGDAQNNSHSTLTIDSVSLKGPGVGTVIAVTDVKIAPLIAGTHATAGANYVVYPPVEFAGACHKQALDPVKGYPMKPGRQFRLWIMIRALKPGRWSIPAQVVTYSENGGTYTHTFPIHYWGTVKTDAHVSSFTDPDMARCVKSEGARYLNFYHG